MRLEFHPEAELELIEAAVRSLEMRGRNVEGAVIVESVQ